MKLFKGFGEAYDLRILYPSSAFISVNEFVEALFEKTFQKIKLKMNFLDAMILNVAEESQSSKFITWNTKHFRDYTYLCVQTPKEFLED